MYSHQCVKDFSCRECLVAFPAQLNPDKYSSLIKIVDLSLSGHCFSLFMLKKIYSQSLIGNKQANKNPKWVLKLPVPYLKNPGETQKEIAAINRTYGNASLALSWTLNLCSDKPHRASSGVSPAPSCSPCSSCSLTAQPSEQGEVQRRVEAGFPPARGSV